MATGMCAALAPDLFQLDADDTSHPVRPDIPPDDRALDAADSCPAMAIRVLSGEGEELGPRE